MLFQEVLLTLAANSIDIIGMTDTLEPGEGTFVNKNIIYSAIDGRKREIVAKGLFL